MISPQFINECLAGDERAIQTLVRAHQRGVFQIALTVLDDGSTPVGEAADQAETATRDTFVIALDRIGGYREDMPFTTWLYRIAITTSRRRARRWRRERFFGGIWQRLTGRRPQVFPSKGVPAGAGPAEGSSQSLGEPGDELFRSVRRLNEKLRLPVVLRYYHDYPVAEIARLLRLGEGAVHARLDAAREKIAGLAAIEAEDDDDD